MNLFIDTNIFLSFYHLASDDLEELKKLHVLIKEKKLNLHIPQQVIDEFKRNRDNKISDSLKTLLDQKFNFQFPQICKDYGEYNDLRGHLKELSSSHSELIKKLKEDIENHNLKADKLIKSLFTHGITIDNDDDLVGKAKLRYDRGNPPGKNRSLGDAINWESMLENIPELEDLYFISEDRDYCSPLNNNKFNSYLDEEWHKTKKSDLHFFKRISNFFKEKFPDIKLASELQKELAIRSLSSSHNFTQTHNIISKLNKHSDFTITQINDMVSAANSNNQVSWIITDDDVFDFYKKITDGNEEKLNQDELKDLKKILVKGAENEVFNPDIEIPF